MKNIVNDAEFQKELITAGDRLVVVNFSATWYVECSSNRIDSLVMVLTQLVNGLYVSIYQNTCHLKRLMPASPAGNASFPLEISVNPSPFLLKIIGFNFV